MASEAPTGSQALIDLLAPPRRQAMISIFGDKVARNFMGPIAFIDDGKLCSPTAINFFRRDFSFISRVLRYEYEYRSWNGFDQSLLDRYGEMIASKLTKISTLLDNWNKRFAKLMEQNGVKMDSAVYSHAIETPVPIIASHARAYFQILKDLDQLNLIAGTANLMGVIDSTQRAEAEFMCKKAVRAFGAALRQEVIRIYREADRLIKAQHGAGETNAAQAATVEAQGNDIAEFGKAIDEDGKGDRSLDLGSGDPNQVVDDAAAASTAATAASDDEKPARSSRRAPAKAVTTPA